jgi:hypothetical protein
MVVHRPHATLPGLRKRISCGHSMWEGEGKGPESHGSQVGPLAADRRVARVTTVLAQTGSAARPHAPLPPPPPRRRRRCCCCCHRRRLPIEAQIEVEPWAAAPRHKYQPQTHDCRTVVGLRDCSACRRQRSRRAPHAAPTMPARTTRRVYFANVSNIAILHPMLQENVVGGTQTTEMCRHMPSHAPAWCGNDTHCHHAHGSISRLCAQ